VRALTQLLVVVAGIAVIAGAAFGFRTVLPALGGLVRVLANPVVLIGLIAIGLLLRMGFPRRPPPRGPRGER